MVQLIYKTSSLSQDLKTRKMLRPCWLGWDSKDALSCSQSIQNLAL